MARNGRSLILPWVAAALPILLILLGTLQYRWIGEVSRAERDRLQLSLDRSASFFVATFDREISQAWVTFQYDSSRFRGRPPRGRKAPSREHRHRETDPHDLVRERYGRWLAVTEEPDLIEAIYLVDTVDGERASLEQMAFEDQSFERVEWPPALEPVRQIFDRDRGRSPASMSPVVAEVPALVTSLVSFSPSERNSSFRVPRKAVVLSLDRTFLTERYLPGLIAHSFGTDDSLQYDLQIVDRATGTVVYADGPSSQSFSEPDATIEFFVPRPFGRPDGDARTSGRERFAPPPPSFVTAAWELQLQHRAGSLEAVVARTRSRNLFLSAGILTLLAAAVGLLVSSARRAQNLAQQQLEFVAGITHELNTPLAAIRSAGQNLADGVVSDDQKIERYGKMIVKEGHRLSTLVGQALDFAGLQGGTRRPFQPQPLDLSRVLEQAVENSEWLRQETQASVELDLDPSLPPVLGDSSALVRMFDNLLTNAIKYGHRPDEAGQVVITARRISPSSIQVSVADNGPGIPASERSHIFEPFFRGSTARNGTISGSGLGLALVQHIVEQHDGELEVHSSETGTRVEVSLPAEGGFQA